MSDETSGAAGRYEGLSVLVATYDADGRANRIEIFDADALDFARERYRELGGQT
ncbi:MAG: hypothetical protein JO086_01545 [Acidimicrobiia bacterium]|nr:hypothetical protein [Acidimicrobiia bacterium]